MTILVDAPHSYPGAVPHLSRAKWCHMTSDASLEELHAFAARLGLRREWFQDGRHPHYDIVLSNRRRAVAWGAREVNSRELVRGSAALAATEV